MHIIPPKERATKMLSEQVRLNEIRLQNMKDDFGITDSDCQHLMHAHALVMENLESLASAFYNEQLNDNDAALLIGDAETLSRLKASLEEYIETLFLGDYDMDYVNFRLRIGVVHKRIGVNVRMFLAGVSFLKGRLARLFIDSPMSAERTQHTCLALDRLIAFDTSLIIETYQNALMAEVENERNRSLRYAEKVEGLNNELTRLTNTDTLTQLHNRHFLNQQAPKLISSCKRRGHLISAVYIDIDNFKEINDIEGHDRGDEILCQLADIIRAIAYPDHLCFRIGGDEFLILCPDCDHPTLDTIFTEKFQQLVSNTEGLEISFGLVTQRPKDISSIDHLISEADKLMYKAKSSKKGKVSRIK
ncbi:GGDEF domain-containing protein [Shewanella corallii]|uniref:Diguanylate cyclase DosC n=1 Tax=Shewanella corallii TaxID=560080 RepID=A0ABT0NCW0_9GAMM|nr:GGDEF domain-containing protein [Shewanella corallii]MCL2916313.1 GGDEF domain-containing protein [Shewanella corallii]